MTAINFPDSPSVNDIFTSGSSSWQWDGTTWKSTGLAELEYLDGLTSNIQTQLDSKKEEVEYEISANTNLVSIARYYVDTTTALTLTLPSAPAVNDEIWIIDQTNLAETNNITVNNNGSLINGVSDTLNINVNGAVAILVYTGSTIGWRI